MEEEKKNGYIYAYESALNKLHHIIKWLVIIIIILIVSLVGSNLAWVIYENQFEDYSETVTQESDTGTNNYIGDDGLIINGK